MKHRTPANKPATATPAASIDVPAFNPAEAFDSFAALALSRSAVKLESANYSDVAGYRQDRRTIEKQTAGLRAALDSFHAIPRPYHAPEDMPRINENRARAGWQLIASALSDRFNFNPCRLDWEYCAGQYQPTEIRGAAWRVAASAVRHLEPVKDYDGARYQIQRLGWVMKDAGRSLNSMLSGIARCNGIPSGYYAPHLTRPRARCLLNFARVLHAEISGDVLRAFGRIDAPQHDPDGLRWLERAALNLVKDAEKVAHLSDDPLPGWAPGAALADHARQLYPNPDAIDAGLYS
jgi:hypothetical protein